MTLLRSFKISPVFMRTLSVAVLAIFALMTCFSYKALYAQAAPIILGKTVIQAGIYKFTMPKITISGTSLSKAELSTILDVKSKEPAKQRFAKLTFAEATIPELVIETNIANHLDKQTYRNVKLTNAVAGAIAFITADDAVIDSKPQKEGLNPFKATYGATVIEGMNLIVASEVFGETSANDTAPLREIYSSYVMNGFKFDISAPDAKITMSSGKITAGAFKARSSKIGFLELANLLNENPDFEDIDDDVKVKLLSSFVDVFSNFDLGPWQIDNLVFSAKASTDNKKNKKAVAKPGSNFDMKINTLKFGQLDSNFHMEGMEVAVPDENILIKLASYNLKGYALKPTLEALKAFIASGKFEYEDIAAIDYRDFIPVLGTSELRGFYMEAPDKKGDFGGAVKLGIGEIKTKLYNQIRGVPTAVNYALKNVTIDIPENSPNEGVRLLRDSGIERLDFSANIEAKWVEERKEFEISNISMSAEKLGSLKLSGAMGNIPKELFTGSLSTAQILALAMTAKAVEVKLENMGLIELVFKKAAQDTKKPEDELRKEAVDKFKEDITKPLGESEPAKALVEGVATFLKNGKSLTVSIKPKSVPDRSLDGIGAMDIFLSKDAKEVLDKLDVVVKAE